MDFLEAIREPEISELFLFWLRRRPGHGVPTRKDIDPSKIPARNLPYLFLYERQRDGRFQCKLIGTALARVLGDDSTGKYLDEILPELVVQDRLEMFRRVLDTEMPIYYRGPIITRNRHQRRFARILLPLSSRKSVADQVFGMARFGPIDRQVPQRLADKTRNEPTNVVDATEEDLAAAAIVAGGGAAGKILHNTPLLKASIL